MSDARKQVIDNAFRETPRDLPMPAYRYQKDTRPAGDKPVQSEAAAILRE